MSRLSSCRFVALAAYALWAVSALGGDPVVAAEYGPTRPLVEANNPFGVEGASSKRAVSEIRTKPEPKKPGAATHPVQPTKPVKPAEVEARINRVLDSPTQIEFVETPLKDVVDYLKDLHHIEIQLDSRALKQAGVEESAPVTKNLKGISLRSALRLTLAEIADTELTYVIRDEVLLITSKAKAEKLRTTRVYDVADLVVCQDSKAKLWDDYATLIDVIRETVCPQSWHTNGGKGTIKGASMAAARVLVVSQTQQVHEEIEALLKELRSAAAKRRGGGNADWPQRDPVKRPDAGMVRVDVRTIDATARQTVVPRTKGEGRAKSQRHGDR